MRKKHYCEKCKEEITKSDKITIYYKANSGNQSDFTTRLCQKHLHELVTNIKDLIDDYTSEETYVRNFVCRIPKTW